MTGSAASPTVTVVRRDGDPFDSERFEAAPAPVAPAHVAILHKLFYDSTVDLGGLVRIDGRTYICTRMGWRVVPAPAER